MVATHPQAGSPFFRLPGEIRENIQRLSLTPRDHIDLLTSGTAKHPEILFRTSSRQLPAIMCTCKKMYTEMSSFAFTEVIVYESLTSFGPSTSLICHGNLRFERLRRVTMTVAIANSNFVSPSWIQFLLSLLQRSDNVDRLDIEFYENNFQKEVDEALAGAEQRRRDGVENEDDAFSVERYVQPQWLEDIARQPNVRRVYFDGNVPKIWLQRLRQLSEGRLQVFSDGFRFREEQALHTLEERVTGDHQGDSNAATENDGPAGSQEVGSKGSHAVQFQVLYEPASRFD